jgi:SAM-dependent methyltransferase
MDAWFRAPRRRLRFWQDFYKSPDSARVPVAGSPFARWVHRWLREHAGERPPGRVRILDVGAGTGRDSTFFAARGHRVVALDFTTRGMRRTERRRRRRHVRVRVGTLNLEDLRSVLLTGARLAHQPGQKQVYARGLLDSLGDSGRDNFWRLASMLQRRGGETFVEFRTPLSRREPKHFGPHQRSYLEPGDVVREIEAYGGRVVHRTRGRDLAPLGEENPDICRLVVRWTP